MEVKMKLEKNRRINIRLTPTDRVTIDRIIELVPSTISDVIRYAIQSAFLLSQCAREAGSRLVLRNDVFRLQEDIDFTLGFAEGRGANGLDTTRSNEAEIATSVIQIRLAVR